MLFTVKEDLILVRELKVTPKQLMFIKMLVRDYSMDEASWKRHSYAMSLEYQTLCPLTLEEIHDLVARDIVLDLNDKSGKIFYDCFEINPKYQRKFVIQITGMPSDLCEAYPYEIINADFRFFAKDASADEIGMTYLKAINKSKEEHERVMDDLEWAKQNNALPVGLKKFVNSKYWIYIRQLRARIVPKTIPNAKLG